MNLPLRNVICFNQNISNNMINSITSKRCVAATLPSSHHCIIPSSLLFSCQRKSEHQMVAEQQMKYMGTPRRSLLFASASCTPIWNICQNIPTFLCHAAAEALASCPLTIQITPVEATGGQQGPRREGPVWPCTLRKSAKLATRTLLFRGCCQHSSTHCHVREGG